VEPLTGYTVLRARKEFQNQSSLSSWQPTNRQFDAAGYLADDAYAGGLDSTGACQDMQHQRVCRGNSHCGQHRGDPATAENNVHSFQRPTRIISASIQCDDAAGLRLVSFGKISGEHAFQQLRQLQVAGLRLQRPWLRTARGREEPVELVPVA
jgi:hypothetical protein